MSTQAAEDQPAETSSPLVSVLMPAYNVAQYVDAAVASIVKQVFANLELVIVDDGSTDETRAKLREWAERDSRVRVIEMPHNGGIVGALNAGLDACRGRFIARMDADDVSEPDRLQVQVDTMQARPDVVVLGAALTYIDERGQPLGLDRRCELGRLLSVCPLLHPTVMMRADVLHTHDIRYRDEFGMSEDYYLWLELSRHGRLEAIDDVVLRYRLRQGATRMKHLKGMLRATLRVKWCAVRRLGLRPGVRDVGRFAAECVLLALPAGVVRRLYLRMTFGAAGGASLR